MFNGKDPTLQTKAVGDKRTRTPEVPGAASSNSDIPAVKRNKNSFDISISLPTNQPIGASIANQQPINYPSQSVVVPQPVITPSSNNNVLQQLPQNAITVNRLFYVDLLQKAAEKQNETKQGYTILDWELFFDVGYEAYKKVFNDFINAYYLMKPREEEKLRVCTFKLSYEISPDKFEEKINTIYRNLLTRVIYNIKNKKLPIGDFRKNILNIFRTYGMNYNKEQLTLGQGYILLIIALMIVKLNVSAKEDDKKEIYNSIYKLNSITRSRLRFKCGSIICDKKNRLLLSDTLNKTIIKFLEGFNDKELQFIDLIEKGKEIYFIYFSENDLSGSKQNKEDDKIALNVQNNNIVEQPSSADENLISQKKIRFIDSRSGFFNKEEPKSTEDEQEIEIVYEDEDDNCNYKK